MKKYGTWIALGLLFLQVGLLILLNLFYNFVLNYDLHRVVLAFMFVVCAGTALYYGYLCGWTPKKNILLAALSVVACPGLAVILLMFLLNNVFGVDRAVTIGVTLPVASVYALTYFLLQMQKIRDGSALRKAVAGTLCGVLLLSECVMPIGDYLKNLYKVPTLTGLSTYTEKVYQKVDNADFYVSVDGDDASGNGTFGDPFRTIERAKEAVRLIDKTDRTGITVAIKAGEYRTNGLVFTEEDSGTESCPITYCAYGDGEVVVDGGVTLDPKDFSPVKDDAMKKRLNKNVRDKVLQLDLSDYGITAEQYGKISVFGSHTAASKYDKYRDDKSVYSELFFNDTRMNLARYPDTGFIETGKVVEMGKGLESDGSTTADPDYWEKVRNPKGDTYRLSKKLSDRVASWQTLDDVWMFGFFKYTWADSTTPIAAFDAKTRTLTTEIVSLFGAIEGAPYYFFNVFEELDAPGEWYLDRNTGVLYMYPSGDMDDAVIDMSLGTAPIIHTPIVEKTDEERDEAVDEDEEETDLITADHLVFKKLTVKGTRGNAIELNGSNNTVTLCTVKNIGENAIVLNGRNNVVSENEISHTGKGGIVIKGGNRKTLTPGRSIAYNNLVCHWSEVYLTYQPAVTLKGVGNICSHNEMYDSPHEAITYSGNDHLIEYNNIHDVCLLSDDAGAIYSGRHWDWYGTVIQYNAVYDLGSGDHRPCGIYMDDALSGQTIYGNIMVNVPDIGIELGGGRDLIVKNNIVINSNERPLTYDQRARDGAVANGWFNHSSQEDGDMWVDLYNSPWQTEEWRSAFPQYERYSNDFSATDDPDFVPNPAYSEVTGNVFINLFKRSGNIDKSVYLFSKIQNNRVYGWSAASSVFVDHKNGDYRLQDGCRIFKDIPEFKQIPISDIGRE